MNNGKNILVHQAEIKTASVSIKALTVNGRQVTMGLFRQLQNEDLISDETAQLLGEPWGKVNYFWPDCGGRSFSPHLHVVWQKAEELRRACVYRDPPPDELSDFKTWIRRAYELYLVNLTLEGRFVRDPDKPAYESMTFTRTVSGFETHYTMDREDSLFRATAPDYHEKDQFYKPYNWDLITEEERRAALDKWRADREKSRREYRLSVEQAMAQLRKEYSIANPDSEGALEVLKERVFARDKYIQDWAETFGKMEALEQLFIAV